MLRFPSFYGSYDDACVQEPTLVNVMDGVQSILSSSSKSGSKRSSTDACKSHKEAERRRRQRINAHLSTLRSLLPSTTKTDKASLLAEVVHHVKELRKRASTADVATGSFPGESDEATLSYCDDNSSGSCSTGMRLMRVSICCEDRPGLSWDLSQAIRSVRARAVRAEMMTVGGRTRSVVMVQWGSGRGGDEDVGILRRASKAVVENRVSGSGLGHLARGNHHKRVRGFGLVDGDAVENDELIIR